MLSSRPKSWWRSSSTHWAREQGLSLTGPDGLLKQLAKTGLETSLNEEMTEHLGYEKPRRFGLAGVGAANVRCDTRLKTVLTEASTQRAVWWAS